MEKFNARFSRRLILRGLVGFGGFGSQIMSLLGEEGSKKKYNGKNLGSIGRHISQIAQGFVTTKVLAPENTTKIIVHIGQEHQSTCLPLEKITRTMAQRVISIQKAIIDLLNSTIHLHDSPIFIESYCGGYGKECYEKSLQQAVLWDGYLGIGSEDWLLFFSGGAPTLYQRGIPFLPAESQQKYDAGIRRIKKSVNQNGLLDAWTPTMKKEICTHREEYALTQILNNAHQIPYMVYGNGHDFSDVIKAYNIQHPRATLAYRKLSPKICFQK